MLTSEKICFEEIAYVPGACFFEKVKEHLLRNGLAYVKNFPLDADVYLALVENYGQPLVNYSSKSLLDDGSPNPYINRVKFKLPKNDEAVSIHYVGAELKPHNARSWLNPRPKYFAMLMVDPGWRDTDVGSRGESKIVEWADFFYRLRKADAHSYDRHIHTLLTTNIRFIADNVKEEVLDSPLVYELQDKKGPFDFGVRLKQDLLERYAGFSNEIKDSDCYLSALTYLVNAVRAASAHKHYVMDSGDLIIMDNNRFAHGRYPIVGQRTEQDGEIVSNPRELWSLSLA
ncbi:Fe(II)-2OG oxygenase family protein [Pseudomonas amygdali pv. morsprunorum]